MIGLLANRGCAAFADRMKGLLVLLAKDRRPAAARGPEGRRGPTRACWPFMDHAESDVLASMTLPARHRTKLHSTIPIEHLNGELERRTPPRPTGRVSF